MNTNYQKEFEKIVNNGETFGKKLLLHSCCAPCSSYCMEYLWQWFDITVFYYNPNITEEPEYCKRVEEEKRLIRIYNEENPDKTPIKIIEGDYEPERFFDAAKGLELCHEGGERCFKCYELRLDKTAQLAMSEAFDYFTTTLTISPLKNAEKLNEIGICLGQRYGVQYLMSDFKKKDGYKRSIELSAKYDLYRQDYCGCVYSKAERELQKRGGA